MKALSRRFVPNWVLISLTAIVLCGQAALAQTQQSDYERLRYAGRLAIQKNSEPTAARAAMIVKPTR